MSDVPSGTAEAQLTDGKWYTHLSDFYNPSGPRFCISSKRTPQLELRSPLPSDAPALLTILSDRRNTQYDKSCDSLDTPEAIGALIQQWRSFSDPLERANVVVVISGNVVGTGGLGWIGKRKTDGKMIGDAGILLNPDVRGRGYAYEALRIIIDHGFHVLGMDEVHVACVDANAAMKGLMSSKFGFEAAPIQDKQFGNEWIWRISKDQWRDSPHSA
ncbi:MAG: hypothetical protein M1820_008131 [Bogoriella megaspora]|nr:MAG: hypothetical protein M1820_008131 [Bogoriella megaspora]